MKYVRFRWFITHDPRPLYWSSFCGTKQFPSLSLYSLSAWYRCIHLALCLGAGYRREDEDEEADACDCSSILGQSSGLSLLLSLSSVVFRITCTAGGEGVDSSSMLGSSSLDMAAVEADEEADEEHTEESGVHEGVEAKEADRGLELCVSGESDLVLPHVNPMAFKSSNRSNLRAWTLN